MEHSSIICQVPVAVARGGRVPGLHREAGRTETGAHATVIPGGNSQSPTIGALPSTKERKCGVDFGTNMRYE